ncbi:reverse transcriptase domain-containing protein, partial [Klebsiella pneumoniae]|uniref:reverse transcriptase domain-containing protein n=1 Tax=Klebsiella pneumoniae TaxID=573 RepID=UPI0040555BA1
MKSFLGVHAATRVLQTIFEFTVNYIDDILVFSRTYSEHIDHLKQLLEAIKSEGFRLKFIKCTFAANSV